MVIARSRSPAPTVVPQHHELIVARHPTDYPALRDAMLELRAETRCC